MVADLAPLLSGSRSTFAAHEAAEEPSGAPTLSTAETPVGKVGHNVIVEAVA